jgi:hypothetical protein
LLVFQFGKNTAIHEVITGFPVPHKYDRDIPRTRQTFSSQPLCLQPTKAFAKKGPQAQSLIPARWLSPFGAKI